MTEVYVIVITWARGICLICMPKPEGHRPEGEGIYCIRTNIGGYNIWRFVEIMDLARC